MREIRLTELSQSLDLIDGSSKIYAVFNRGELRVAISDEDAQVLTKYIYGKHNDISMSVAEEGGQEPSSDEVVDIPDPVDDGSEQG